MKKTLRMEFAVVVAMVAALPLLAFLQYKWIGDISRAERDRLQAAIQQAGSRFAAEFDAEIARYLPVGPRRGPMQFVAPEEYADALALWSESGELPRMLRSVYLVHEDEVRVYDLASRRFQPAHWPPELGRVRQLISERSRPLIVDSELPAIAIVPMRPFGGRPPDHPGPPFAFGDLSQRQCLIIVLDKQYLQSDLLPEMARRHFGNEFAAQIVAVEGKSVLYQTEGTRALPADERLWLSVWRPPGMGGPSRGGGPMMMQARAWELLLWHRAGSLDQIVEAARTRNLAVSTAILLLLGGGFVVLVRSARRDRQFAQLQMEFVAGVSHELRTPLAVIRSAGENLADGVVTRDDQVRNYGALIRGEGQRLSAMVEQILRFAGIQAGSAKYEFDSVAVRPLLDRAVEACRTDYDRAGRVVEVHLPDDLPPLQADDVAIEQCVRNLLENALKHATGTTRVEASAADGFVSITVTDGGPGIEPVDRPRVFEPFYRGRRAVAEQIRGAGLGLSLVKRIMEAHGGDAAVTSAPGNGSAFVLRIPVAKEQPE